MIIDFALLKMIFRFYPYNSLFQSLCYYYYFACIDRVNNRKRGWYNVDGHIGESLMEVAKRHNLPSIEATCGGELECATCHAYLCDASDGSDPATRGDINRAPSWSAAAVSDEEDDMLEYALRRKHSSRLTCQVRVTPGMAAWMKRGGRIELPQH